MNTASRHGGRRPGSGRPPRQMPKSKAIWCGQITEAERETILAHLSPDERASLLLAAAEVEQSPDTLAVLVISAELSLASLAADIQKQAADRGVAIRIITVSGKKP